MLRTLLFLFMLVTLTAFAIPAFAQTATNVPATTPDPLFLGDGFTYLKSDIDPVSAQGTGTMCSRWMRAT